MMKPVATVAAESSAPLFHRFRSRGGEHLLVVPYSRIFDLAPNDARLFDDPDRDLDQLLRGFSKPETGEAPLEDVVTPSPQAVSLNVSASCNLSCGYCYAARGAFDGAQPNPMPWETARAAIDALLRGADPVHPITVGFLGGEPFANRALIHQSVAHAATEASARGLDVRFSVTTNGTLLTAEDLALLRAHPFAVTVSIDGGSDVQDRQRPHAGRAGRGSFAALERAITPLLADPGRARICARATVTRRHLELTRYFVDIVALGFSDVGFSPLRVDKGGGEALRDADWPLYLDALTTIAGDELARARRGQPIRLANLAVALKQIARGASSPYPCGAGGGYFSVASDGRWYACHRAIGKPAFEMGDSHGLDEARRRTFLLARHVHAQDACRVCWARYLCSGACHHEADARSDSACGFIRGWLDFCLTAYCELPSTAWSARTEGREEPIA
jgi:uncharacterized protein